MKKINTKKTDRNVESAINPALDSTKNRNFITVEELELLVKACSKARHSPRNQAIIQTMFWHGLRVSELCQLKTADLDLKTGRLIVSRLKSSLPTTP